MRRQCLFTLSEYVLNKGHIVYIANENDGYKIHGYFGDDSDQENSLTITNAIIASKNAKNGLEFSDVHAIMASVGIHI